MQDQYSQGPAKTSLSANKPYQLYVLMTVQVGHKHDIEKMEDGVQS